VPLVKVTRGDRCKTLLRVRARHRQIGQKENPWLSVAARWRLKGGDLFNDPVELHGDLVRGTPPIKAWNARDLRLYPRPSVVEIYKKAIQTKKLAGGEFSNTFGEVSNQWESERGRKDPLRSNAAE